MVPQLFVSIPCPHKLRGQNLLLWLDNEGFQMEKHKVCYFEHSSENLLSVICHLCLKSSLINYTGVKATGKQMFKAQRCQRDQARGWVSLQQRP